MRFPSGGAKFRPSLTQAAFPQDKFKNKEQKVLTKEKRFGKVRFFAANSSDKLFKNQQPISVGV
ncbi:MAG: hypothetical protein L6Q74_14875 [Sphaerotilus natans subsp. sulfidivorans]|uniref:hypothetical protein n=1 Tax=Sphaerotilus sulfidivorans TaxID=639200 RepID=UPI002354040F|nr:hypothetical protein [Sphaerotilus sulfidivorans]MCK6403165.1 hypothetical protein [Sphaerotilus sulfidivorans]